MAFHWQIAVGIALGALFGMIMAAYSGGSAWVENWIYPLGVLFIRLLKLVAVPLVIASLIKGVSDLQDISKFSKIGLRTLLLYILTTLIAISIGLGIADAFKPGHDIPENTIARLTHDAGSLSRVGEHIAHSQMQKHQNPLDFVLGIVPQNIFRAATDNHQMLQVIFFSVFLGICLLLIPAEKAQPLKNFFDSLNTVVLKMVDLIISMAPLAVFALIANVAANAGDAQVLVALLQYILLVLLGLALMAGVYGLFILLFAGKNPFWFFKQLAPAQLLAFSTSSSLATLPLTMKRVNAHIGVDEEVSSFVLPLGATLNMDGTSLYQAVATIFICEALHFNLAFSDQLVIVLTALLASIGTAGVPGAGVVMLIIVLQSIGFPPDKLPVGISLILSVDRLLDMARTVVNITGDAMVSTVVAKSVGKLHLPAAVRAEPDAPSR